MEICTLFTLSADDEALVVAFCALSLRSQVISHLVKLSCTTQARNW